MACKIFSWDMWDLDFPDQGSNPGLALSRWELRVLAAEPPSPLIKNLSLQFLDIPIFEQTSFLHTQSLIQRFIKVYL